MSERSPIDREHVRSRLHGLCASMEGEWPSPELGVAAAVLIGMVAHPEGPSIILTERTAHLDNHAGQVSLPGGKIEPGDGGPAEAALRETFEEIGLAPERIELLGCLRPHDTISGFRVYPFVGWIDDPGEFVLDEHEVAGLFEVPLDFVLDPENHTRDSLTVDGVVHHFYVLPYLGHRIWGATAGMLVELAQVLAPWKEVRTHG